MTIPNAPRNRNDFRVAIFCALPLEADAVQSVFDKCWEDVGNRYGKALGDQNAYTTGAIGSHNVVLVHMPRMGITSAAISAAGLRSSFARIQLAIVVGICGVVPFHPETQEEIVLGDIIVSTAVTQYDFGRQSPSGFKRKKEIDDSLGRAGPEVQAFVNMLQSRYSRQRLKKDLKQLLHSDEFRANNPDAVYPGIIYDQLYDASYLHQHHSYVDCDRCQDNHEICSKTCSELGCEMDKLVPRKRHCALTGADMSNSWDEVPVVHFGRFGSANMVMKSGIDRDAIATSDKVIAFEMEGAGVWEQHQTVVIKAACDYADSHKNKQWQSYAAKMAAAFLGVFLTEWVTANEMDDEVDTHEEAWYVPFDHTLGFVGRTEELSWIKNMISSNNSRRVISILGLGGVGKGRLVLELAHQLKSEHQDYSVFWVQGATQSTFESDMLAVGRVLEIPGIDDAKADVKNLVKQRLNAQFKGRWVMILDNADDEDLWGPKHDSNQAVVSLATYLPRSAMGSIIVTTRTRRVATFLAGREVLGLSDLPPEQAVDMLRGGLENSDLLDGHDVALALVDKLNCLPLAIVQAISFINRTQEPASVYIRLLDQPEERAIELLSQDFEEPSGYQRDLYPIATTWLISFEQIRKKHPLALKYLTYMACLLEKNIPLSLLPSSDTNEKLEAIAVLTGYSFLKKQTAGQSATTSEPLYDMHRLVHLSTRNWLRKEGLLLAEIAKCTRDVTDLLPDVKYENKNQWALYLPHSRRLIMENDGEGASERYELMRLVAECLLFLGKYYEASELLTKVKDWAERAFENTDPRRLRAYAGLGSALRMSERSTEAETWLQRAIDGEVHVLGWEHPDILSRLCDLSLIYRDYGRYAVAEKFQLHVLRNIMRLNGPEHISTLLIMCELAFTYRAQGRWREAEKVQLEVIEGITKLFGAEHPRTLSAIGDLASTYTAQGLPDKAERLELQVVERKKRLLGPEHPDTLRCMRNLAITYVAQGRTKEAEGLQWDTIQTLTRTVGAEHPETLRSTAILANIYYQQDRFTEAEKLQIQVLASMKRVLGVRHPDTLTSMHNCACLVMKLGWEEQAKTMMRSCVELRRKSLGSEHYLTQRSLRSLDVWQEWSGRSNLYRKLARLEM